MQRAFTWCFLGSGTIAHKVAKDTEKISIGAVWSRTLDNATRFTETYGGKPYSDLQEALAQPGIDAVYVAVQHPEHMDYAIEAMKAGKPVLCEKPLAVNEEQAKAMQRQAAQSGVYFAEAMWTRFNPIISSARDWIANGEIGEVHYMTADFAGANEDDGVKYHFRKERAGGSLLDVGVYPVSLAHMVMGRPDDVHVHSVTGDGIDLRMAMQLEYADGRSAALFSAFDTHGLSTAQIHGSRGTITIPDFWQARDAFLRRNNGENLQVRRDGCIGWGYMMKKVEQDILAGKKESPEVGWEDSLAVMNTLDRLREKAGVRYMWD